VVVDGLTLLFGILSDTGISSDELKTYTDEPLWAVVHHRLAWPQDTRLCELVALGKKGQITSNEKSEMERLIDLMDHQMLLRSEALLLLKQRGHDVERQLKLGSTFVIDAAYFFGGGFDETIKYVKTLEIEEKMKCLSISRTRLTILKAGLLAGNKAFIHVSVKLTDHPSRGEMVSMVSFPATQLEFDR
jgi:hypothetical protein